jgi:hypothetical protein
MEFLGKLPAAGNKLQYLPKVNMYNRTYTYTCKSHFVKLTATYFYFNINNQYIYNLALGLSVSLNLPTDMMAF